MSSTSPTPDEGSGQTPAPKPSPSIPASPEPQAASLNALTPPTQPDLQQESVRTVHRIMGQRLVIQYETTQLGDREALTTAEMRVIPPFSSSSTQSTPYIMKADPSHLTAESTLIAVLHGLRDSKEPLQDREIIQQLRRLLGYPYQVSILCEDANDNRLRREIPHMTLFAPPLNALEGDLNQFTGRYLSSRVQNGIYQECMCRIDTKNNSVWAHFREADGQAYLKEIDVIGASKDLPSNISESRAMQLAWRNLTGIAETTMRIFQAYGARCGISALKNALPYGKPPNYEKMPVDLDGRLRLGVVRDFGLDTVVTLPSGGKAVLDVGDHVAALCISASDHEHSSTCCFVYDSKEKSYLNNNWDSHLKEIRSLMQKLASSSHVGQYLLLEQLSQHVSQVFDRRCPISHILDERAAQSLAALEEAGSVKLWLPNTASTDGRWDLVQGIEEVHLTLAHIPGGQENLASFSSAQLLVFPAGNVEIYLDNQLRNRIKAVLSEQAVTEWGGVGKVITSLAFALSTRDIAHAHSRVHQLLEKMARLPVSQSGGPEKGSIYYSELPSNNELDLRTFAVALGIVHAAHNVSHCYGNHAVRMTGPSRAVAVAQLVSAPYAIEFEVEDESIKQVVLRGQAYLSLENDRVHCLPTLRFTLPPDGLPLLGKALPEIFADYYQYGGPKGYSSREPDALERTKIFQFLTTHAQRIAENGRA